MILTENDLIRNISSKTRPDGTLGGDNLSAAQGQTYQQFCQGLDSTSHDSLTVDSVAGNTVAVTIVAQHTDGSSQTYRGSYVVGNGVIQSASVQASS